MKKDIALFYCLLQFSQVVSIIPISVALLVPTCASDDPVLFCHIHPARVAANGAAEDEAVVVVGYLAADAIVAHSALLA